METLNITVKYGDKEEVAQAINLVQKLAPLVSRTDIKEQTRVKADLDDRLTVNAVKLALYINVISCPVFWEAFQTAVIRLTPEKAKQITDMLKEQTKAKEESE